MAASVSAHLSYRFGNLILIGRREFSLIAVRPCRDLCDIIKLPESSARCRLKLCMVITLDRKGKIRTLFFSRASAHAYFNGSFPCVNIFKFAFLRGSTCFSTSEVF